VIRLEVIGEPQPQGNKTVVGGGKSGRPARLVEGRRPEARAAFKDWRGAIAGASREWQLEHRAPLIDGPVMVCLDFRMSKPKSAPRWRWLPHARPDLDKLARAVLDGITGTLLTDDGRVVALLAFKRFAIGEPPGVVVEVHDLTELEREGTPTAPTVTAPWWLRPDAEGDR
jgi:crossover junction endodeoxyribonuclease RusA